MTTIVYTATGPTETLGTLRGIWYPMVMSIDIPREPGIRDLKGHLSDYVNRVLYRGDVVWVTKNGRRVAALVPVDAVEAIERLEVEAALAAAR